MLIPRSLPIQSVSRAVLCLTIWLGSLCASLTTSVAWAQPPADQEAEPAGYRALIDEGLREFAIQNFEEARALFGRAHALFPNARTHRALGLVAFELRDYVEAAQQFEQALKSPMRPLDDKLRTDAENVLARAYGFVGRVRVNLRPAGASLSLDGRHVELGAQGIVLVGMGDHTLEAAAAGHASNKQSLHVRGGEELTLEFVLVPLDKKVASSSAGGAVGSDRGQQKGWYKSPWLWVGVGVVVAGAAGGTAYALTRDPARPYGGSSNIVVPGP